MLYGEDEMICDKCCELQKTQENRVKYFLSRQCLNLRLPDNEFWELFSEKIIKHPSEILSHPILQKYLPKLKITVHQFINMLMIDGLTHNDAINIEYDYAGFCGDLHTLLNCNPEDFSPYAITKRWIENNDNYNMIYCKILGFLYPCKTKQRTRLLKPYEGNQFMLLGKTTKKNYMLLYDFCKKEDAILTKDLNSIPNYVILCEDGFCDYYRFAMQKMQDKNVASISIKEFIFKHIMDA